MTADAWLFGRLGSLAILRQRSRFNGQQRGTTDADEDLVEVLRLDLQKHHCNITVTPL
jgi:hypothetical protein